MIKEAQIKHLLNRATFGISIDKYDQTLKSNPDQVIKGLFQNAKSAKSIRVKGVQLPDLMALRNMSKEERQQFRKQSREQLKDVNMTWCQQMAGEDGLLAEKMTLFWHDHFACRNLNGFLAQQHNNTLRKHALGKFGDLLMAVAKDPAMLQFLNNQQNRKESPNENFARELLELFTMGRGNYTEADIKNGARAFTGWGFNLQGEHIFRKRVHDYGEKTFMGRTGDLNGEDIIEIVLENKQTAYFITEKIYRYMVNDTPQENIIKELADGFYRSDYDIKKLLNDIFKSDWFYRNEHVGTRIKSPVELMLGIQHQLGLSFSEPESVLFLQKALGQVLLLPPNVGGWPTGREWIDSSSLTFRMAIPTLIANNKPITYESQKDGDVNTQNLGKRVKNLVGDIAWPKLMEHLYDDNDQQLVEKAERYFLSTSLTAQTKKQAVAYVGTGTDENDRLKKACVAIMSMPEYQLC
ncbi:MAG: DUF1800 domain-containing protein [Bacteroidota bacterium]